MDNEDPTNAGRSRREMFRMGGALAAAAGLGALASGTAQAGHKPKRRRRRAKLRNLDTHPIYFPDPRVRAKVDLSGKFAVVTGASRGIGRAAAESLIARGATVVGTSRDVSSVPNPPAFPLLNLDVTSPASVAGFVGALVSHPSYTGAIDILINNAGRFVIGSPVPPPIAPDPLGFFMDAVDLGMQTLYHGHVRVTNSLLPLMNVGSGYARILFTCSIAGYIVGGTESGAATGQNFFSTYYSGKRALLAYANNLRGFMRVSGSPIQVSTVNPYFINTELAAGLNPIYTEPVDGGGNAPFNPVLQQVLDGTRQAYQFALPPALVGEAFGQLAQMAQATPNVVAASPDEPLATAGANELLEQGYLEENLESAIAIGRK